MPDVLDSPVETSSPWSGVIAVEGEFTGDGRKFDPGALTWDFTHGPLPLTWEEEGGSHDNARHVAWIDSLERQGNLIMGSGTIFDEEFAAYLDKAGQIGISIEPDDISMSVVLPEGDQQEPDPSMGGTYPLLEEQELIHKGRIRAAAAVHVPAFIESVIKPGAASTGQPVAGDAAPGELAAAAGSIEISEELFNEALETGAVVDTGEARDDGAALFERLESPTHAGIALVAADTGRMLMLQRCMSEGDPCGGLWEFPGGGIEEGESPGQAASREFAEETGSHLPEDVKGVSKWDSPDGVYRLHFLETATEDGYALFEKEVPNPDDPDGDVTEALAWWSPAHIAERPSSLRAEVAAMPWEEILPDAVTAAAPPVPAEPAPESESGNLSNADTMFLEALVTHHHDIEELVSKSLPDLNPDVAAWVNEWLPGLQEGTAKLHEWLGLPARTDAAPTEQDTMIASAAPVAPPDDWFEPFDLGGPTPMTVTADGRVYGHLTTWDSCHRGNSGSCLKPPSDPKAPFFQLGQVLTAGGNMIDVGVVTVGGGHYTADGLLTTLEHHDDVTSAAAAVVVQEDEWGIGLFGSITADATPAQVAALRRSPLSGAWRKEKGRYRLKGAHAVNDPGYPIARGLVASVTPDTFLTVGRVEAKEPDTTVINLRAAAQRIARSAGLDTESLVASARAAMADIDCGCDDELVASLSGDLELPLHSYGTEWDGGAAAARVFDHFTEGDKVDTAGVAKAFLWRNTKEPEDQKSGYDLPFADIIDGTLKIVPSGVQAAAGGHGVAQLDASAEDIAAIKGRIGKLYARIKEANPDAPDSPFAPGSSGEE